MNSEATIEPGQLGTSQLLRGRAEFKRWPEMPDMLAVALLTSAGLWLVAHRSTITDLLVRDGLLRQFGIEGREEKITSHDSSLSAGLLCYFQACYALLVSGED